LNFRVSHFSAGLSCLGFDPSIESNGKKRAELIITKAAVAAIPDLDDKLPTAVGSKIRTRKRQDLVNRANASHLLTKRRAIELTHGKSRISVIYYEFIVN
jgi:hypothetical protein